MADTAAAPPVFRPDACPEATPAPARRKSEWLSTESGEVHGQFFTLEPLCKLMVQMTVTPTAEPISIADPACGSGRFFIAAQPLAPNGTFYGIGRNLTCVHMSALNMLVRNADGVIVHGNTLSMETFGGYVTRRTALCGVIRPLDAATAKAVPTKTIETISVKEHPPQATEPIVTPAQSAVVTPAPIFVTGKKGQ